MIVFLKISTVLFAVALTFTSAKGQVRFAPQVDVSANFADGMVLGAGMGFRRNTTEIIPYLLISEAVAGGKIEFRQYFSLDERAFAIPFFSFQQVVMRRLNTCLNGSFSCRYWRFQFLPGIGASLRLGNCLRFLSSMAVGYTINEEWRNSGDFQLRLGLRYEF